MRNTFINSNNTLFLSRGVNYY